MNRLFDFHSNANMGTNVAFPKHTVRRINWFSHDSVHAAIMSTYAHARKHTGAQTHVKIKIATSILRRRSILVWAFWFSMIFVV